MFLVIIKMIKKLQMVIFQTYETVARQLSFCVRFRKSIIPTETRKPSHECNHHYRPGSTGESKDLLIE